MKIDDVTKLYFLILEGIWVLEITRLYMYHHIYTEYLLAQICL